MSRERQRTAEETVSPESTSRSGATPDPLDSDICSFESLEYHSDEDVYRADFDADVVAPSMAVIGAVSAVAGTDPLHIEPLHSTIDPDALDTLFADQKGGEGDLHAQFTLEGYSVTLSSYGSVTVRSSLVESS